MAAIDAYAINELGIPGIVLMENAALKVVEEAAKMLGGLRSRRILLLAGKGNNGGDAFAAARHLRNKGSEVIIYITAKQEEVSGDAGTNLAIAGKTGIQIVELPACSDLSKFSEDISKADLIIDGILGTGFKGELSGLIKAVAGLVNSSPGRVLSIDIPSGVDGGTGRVEGLCIKAERTVTFCLPKVGLVLHPGCDYTGELIVADIGIPEEAIKKQNIKLFTIDSNMISSVIPERKADSNKGSYGRILVISGSTGMTGSGCLCAGAALRSGAGLVYLGVPASLAPIYSSAILEPVILPLEDYGTGRVSKACMGKLLEHLGRMDAAAIGPGLSTGESVPEVIYSVIENTGVPLVIDADALNSIAVNINILKRLKATAVITPHPGEMARLLGTDIRKVQEDRLGAAVNFAAEWGVIVVLKGSRTIIAFPDGRAYINTGGNPGMATAGTGDVLTGIIAGLAGQGMSPEQAAVAGVYLHAAAGDAAALRKGMHGMVAGDLLEELPYIIKALTKGVTKEYNHNLKCS